MTRRDVPNRETEAPRSEVGALIEDRLRRTAYLVLQDVDSTDRDGVVTLRGRLPSRYLKQVAQAVVADIAGVRTIINQIEVGPYLAPLAQAERTTSSIFTE